MKRKSARNLVFRTLASLLMVLVLFTGVSCTEEREPLSTAERCEGSETVLAETSSDQEAPSAEVSEEETTEENGVPTSQETVSSPSPEPPPSSSATPEQTPFDPSSVLSLVPSYVGDPFYILNENEPLFTASELTSQAYESYSDLDSMNRTGVATASCGKEIMPAEGEKRGSISSIKPSGWIQATYDVVSGKYLYNRSHLIGWQLSAENANEKNLITGTKYFNVEGMLPFENMVADYIKETGNHVAYRVTPVYSGSDLVCRGVTMEAYSVEDGGDGICFYVFVYNVQPGVEIDYETGESRLAAIPAVPPVTTQAPITTTQAPTTTTVAQTPQESTYVLNTNTHKVHVPTCRHVKNIKEENLGYHTGPLDAILSQGYSRCGTCLK